MNKEEKKWKRGSLTVEAAFVVPLFFLAVVALIGMLGFYGNYAETVLHLQEEAMGIAAAEIDPGGDAYVDLLEVVTYTPKGFSALLPSPAFPARARVRAWNGRDNFSIGEEASTGQAQEMVYMTPTGSVYHTSTSCGSLALQIREISADTLEWERNASGARFHACEKCVGRGNTGGSVWISKEGDKYHNSRECSGLNRSIRIVPIEEAVGLHECAFCKKLH